MSELGVVEEENKRLQWTFDVTTIIQFAKTESNEDKMATSWLDVIGNVVKLSYILYVIIFLKRSTSELMQAKHEVSSSNNDMIPQLWLNCGYQPNFLLSPDFPQHVQH